MTMIERVAMALSGALGDNWDSPTMFIDDANATHETCREIYRDMARAAIEAMREPTQAMIMDGLVEMIKHSKMQLAWSSMVDKALSEGGGYDAD